MAASERDSALVGQQMDTLLVLALACRWRHPPFYKIGLNKFL